jgi:hypothetical protein
MLCIGGKTAIYGSQCNHTAWKEFREVFIKDELSNPPKKIRTALYLESQTRAIKPLGGGPGYTFEDLCIACADEPVLQCSANNTCVCWKEYETVVRKGEFEDTHELPYTTCRVKRGGRCEPLSEVLCIEGTFCDNDFKNCSCKTSSPSCIRAVPSSTPKPFFFFRFSACILFSVLLLLLVPYIS